ncbi:MAG: DNA gyrase inhibitor YacG [Pirellulaceae bacterium]
MALITCPTCHQRFDSDKTEAMPFCGRRCQLIDLNRWLTESNSLPIDREEGEEMTNDE